ncbi:MAG: glycosyltransferase [Niabella sp.]
MKILITGKYEPDYNRTKIILDGLHCNQNVTLLTFPYKNRLTLNYFKLRKLCKQADIIFIPAFCHQDVALLNMLTNKPIIFDPLISRYLSKVFDYKLVKTNSFRAKKNFYKDKISMSRADVVLCDTEAHKQYYKTTFNLPEEKLKVVEVGVNTTEFKQVSKPATKTKSKFIVGFYGSFVPLQGIGKIIDAAFILKNKEDIEFWIIGSGFEYEKQYQYAIQQLGLTNIHFSGWVPYDELEKNMSSFDVALGIFGDSLKASLVIPNKIYHYAAMGFPIITRDSTAIREVFSNHENIMLTTNTPEAIADAIIKVKNNHQLAIKIGENAHRLIAGQYNHQVIANKVYKICNHLLATK